MFSRCGTDNASLNAKMGACWQTGSGICCVCSYGSYDFWVDNNQSWVCMYASAEVDEEGSYWGVIQSRGVVG